MNLDDEEDRERAAREELRRMHAEIAEAKRHVRDVTKLSPDEFAEAVLPKW